MKNALKEPVCHVWTRHWFALRPAYRHWAPFFCQEQGWVSVESHWSIFTPTHRVISVSRRSWRLPALCTYSRSLIGSWGFWDKADDKFFWLSEFWGSTSVVARHEDAAACLTTTSRVATEDSSRCMREEQSKKHARLHFKPNCKSAFFKIWFYMYFFTIVCILLVVIQIYFSYLPSL